ncbi:MAG: hypothetical protein BMS9Abin05_0763 [Rhodothermia bacterium]|nr:MAG: hypothetical protein BMS9Abin05_0763 [Rhodothermia bacterium]
MSKLAAGIFVFLLLLVYTSANGQSCTAYVNASDGDDSNSGKLTSPLRSIEFAYNTLPGGSEVCIAAGEYFFGDDADGISFSIAGKGMTFVLNAFAGEDEIRFSETSFEIDVGNAAIEFRQGSALNLTIGEGIANVDDADLPDLLNFVHTLRFVSGTLDITGISLSINESVGNPGYVNPLNSAKVAPEDSRIEFGDIDILGTPVYEEAARTVRFRSGESRLLNYPLPGNLAGNRLFFENSGLLTVPSPLNLSTGTLEFRNSGPVRFQGDVQINPDGGLVRIDPSASDVQFEASLVFQGSLAPEALIRHSGGAILDINQLDLLFLGIGGDVDSQIILNGAGKLSIGLIDQQASGDGSDYLIDLVVDSGELLLGGNGIDFRLPGALINQDQVTLKSSIELFQNAEGISIVNSGLINLSSFHLTDSGTSSSASNDGIISGGPGSGIAILGSTVWAGSGSLPNLDVNGAASLGTGLTLTGNLTINPGARVEILSGSDVRVNGDVLSGDDSALIIGSEATLEIDGSSTFTSSSLTYSVNSLMVSGGSIELGSTTLLDVAGRIQFKGTGVRSISGVGPLSLPGLSITESDVRLGTSSTLRDLNITGGGLSIDNGADVTVSGTTSVSSGYFQTPSAGIIEFSGSVLISEGVLNLVGSNAVRFNDDFDWSTGSASFPLSGMVAAGNKTQLLTPSPSFVLPAFSIEGADTRAIVSGSITIDSDVHLNEGTLVLQTGSTLTLNGDLTRSAGILEGEAGTTLQLSGTGTTSLSGFSSLVLPKLEISGPSVNIGADLSLTGGVELIDGMLRINNGSTLSTGSSLVLASGAIDVGPSSRIRSDGYTELRSGSFTLLDGATFEVRGNITITETQVFAETGAFEFAGGTSQTFQYANDLSLGRLRSTTNGTSVSILDSGVLTLAETLRIEAGTIFGIGSNTVVFQGSGNTSGMHVDGVALSGTGVFRFVGPGNPSVSHFLSGAGMFASINVSLDDDTDHLRLTGPSPSFRFSGDVFFESGSIDAAGKLIEPSTSQAVPGIRINLEDSVGPPGRNDGGRFFDSTGELTFNPGLVPFDLAYSGRLNNIYVIGPEFQPGVTRNLEIDAFDATNTPPIFGLQLKDDAQINGSLRVIEGARLNLSAVDLTLAQPQTTHLIDGTVLGTGDLIVTGAGAKLVSPLQSGYIESILISSAQDESLVEIAGIQVIDRLHVLSGGAAATPPLPGAPVLRIREELRLTGGELDISRSIHVGDSGGSGTVALTGGRLRINDEVNIVLSPGTSFTATDPASISITSIGPGNLMSGGFIVFEGDGELASSTPIPRVRIAANANESTSDNLVLTGDTRIGELFIVNAGDVFLGNNVLSIDGGVFRLANSTAPFDETDALFGNGPGDSGELLITGSTRIELEQDLELHSVRFRIAAGTSDVIEFISLTETPRKMILDNQAFILESGVVDLGMNDLVLSGTTDGIFTALGGAVLLSSSVPVVPSKGGLFPTTPEQFPADDDRYGEVVLNGSGDASIRVGNGFTITNLTIDGTARLAADSSPISVAGRLVFGRFAGVFVLGGPDRLVLNDGATLLRRGAGTLTHPPLPLGEYDVFYDLDDGSHSNVDSGFGPGTLTTGFELTANPLAIRNLGILAGARFGFINTLEVTSDIQVSGAFSLFSGSVDFGPFVLSLASGAAMNLDEVDSDAPLSMESASGYIAQGPIDFRVNMRYRDFQMNDSILPAGIQVENFEANLGHALSNTNVDILLHRDLNVKTFQLNAISSDSRFDLNGHSVRANQTIDVAGGSLMSFQNSLLTSLDSVAIAEGSRVLGDVSIVAGGPTFIAGSFEGPSVTLSGDLFVTGSIDAGTSLTFTGTTQILESSHDLVVQDLNLSLEATSGNEPRTVLMVGREGPFAVILGGRLLLENGILETGGSRIVLPGSSSGFERSVSAATWSHVSGNVSRNAPERTTDTFFFPVGDEITYRPLALSFTTPRVPETELSVGHFGARPFGAEGLPLPVGENVTIRSILDFGWTVTSSEIIPVEQNYVISTRFEADGIDTPSDLRLLSRPSGSFSSAWSSTSLDHTIQTLPEGLELIASDIRGGLGPQSEILGIGYSSLGAAEAEFQFISAYPFEDAGNLQVEIGGIPVVSQLSFNSATSAASVFLSGTQAEQVPISIRDTTIDQDLFSGMITLAPGGRTIAALVLSVSGDPRLLSLSTDVLNNLQPDELGLGFIGAAPDLPIRGISLDGSNILEFESAVNPSIFAPIVISPQQHTIDLVQDVVVDYQDQYRFDFSGLGGEVSILLHSGFLNVPDPLGPDRAAGLWIVLSDGSVLPALPTTKVDPFGPASDLPGKFQLRGNYPNPFNPRTTILYDLPQAAEISLVVVDVLGRVVFSVDEGFVPAGSGRQISIDASRLASGTYLYRIRARTDDSVFVGTGKMVLVR